MFRKYCFFSKTNLKIIATVRHLIEKAKVILIQLSLHSSVILYLHSQIDGDLESSESGISPANPVGCVQGRVCYFSECCALEISLRKTGTPSRAC